MGASIVDVARAAGVSHSTVSRVLNNRPGVSEDAAKRVRRAMAEMGYERAARRPGRKPSGPPGLSTGNIGLVMIGSRATLATAPVAARVFHVAEEALTELGFNLIVCQTDKGRRLPPKIDTGQIDGLLLHGSAPDEALREIIRHQPTVWLLSQRSRRGFWGDRVGPDNEAIGRIAAEHLADHGHRHVAQLTITGTHLGFELRKEAFTEVAESRGATVACLTLEGHDRSDQVDSDRIDEIADRFMALDPRPTGLFVPRDRVTVRVYHALRARGIDPASDVQLVSCDNDPILGGLETPPPTIDIRPEQIARRAIEQLQWRMEHPSEDSRVTVTVEPRLVSRDSSSDDSHAD